MTFTFLELLHKWIFSVFDDSRLKASHVTQSFELGCSILILTHLQRILNLV
jgi:hypothetical protein